LGRYTHRVAISNDRLLDIDHGQITFRYKDYRDHDRQKTMTLPAEEFIRRFLLHVLPDGFQRIRHYGFLAHRYGKAKLALARQLLGAAAPVLLPPLNYRDYYQKLTGVSLRDCPVCHQGHMVPVRTLPPTGRPPPKGEPR